MIVSSFTCAKKLRAKLPATSLEMTTQRHIGMETLYNGDTMATRSDTTRLPHPHAQEKVDKLAVVCGVA